MTRSLTLIVLVWLGSGCPSATDDRLRTAMDQLARIRQEQDRQSRQLTEVAGIPFTVERVQEALERARKARSIEIKILRRGATRVIKVAVVR